MKCPKCGFEDFKDTDTICKGCGESVYNIKNNITTKDTIEILEIHNEKLINTNKNISSEDKNIKQMKNINKNNLNKEIINDTSKENNQTNIKNEINKNNNSKKSNTKMLLIISVIVFIIVTYQLLIISSKSTMDLGPTGGLEYLFVYVPAMFFLISIDMIIIGIWISYGLWVIWPIVYSAIINYYKKSSPTEKRILLIILFVIMVQLAIIIFFLLKKHNIKFEDVVNYIIGFIIKFIKHILPL